MDMRRLKAVWVAFGGGGGGFEDFFGGGGGRRGGGRGRVKQSGSDLRYDLQITLEEAAKGVEKELEIEKDVLCKKCAGKGSMSDSGVKTCTTCAGQGVVTRQAGIFVQQTTCPECRGSGEIISDPCDACNGQGKREEKARIKIRIPAGVDTGTRLRSSGNGDCGLRGGPAGDLYVFINVKAHDVFDRDGEDLHCEVPMPFSVATLGGELKVPTLEGKSSIKIPAGTQGNTVFRLRQKGITDLQSGYKGDLHVTVHVEVPTKLDSDQKDKLLAFSESIGEENSPMQESFFEKAKRFFGT